MGINQDLNNPSFIGIDLVRPFKTIRMDLKKVKISKIKANDYNPRYIKEENFEKLKRSIQEFPEMLEKRPLVVDEDMVVLGGNMRLKALKELKYKEIPVIIAEGWSEEKKAEFIIKDNVGYGSWDWDLLANEWDLDKLDSWGMEIPGFDISEDELGADFELPDGEKEPFESMTFKLSDEQADQIKNALEEIRKEEEFKYMETFGNDNSNGNALYLLVTQWERLKK